MFDAHLCDDRLPQALAMHDHWNILTRPTLSRGDTHTNATCPTRVLAGQRANSRACRGHTPFRQPHKISSLPQLVQAPPFFAVWKSAGTMRCSILFFLFEMLRFALVRALLHEDPHVAAILEENAALRRQVAELVASLEKCSLEMTTLRSAAEARKLQNGCSACDTTTTTVKGTETMDPHWNVDSGECVLSNDCISSPHFSGQYCNLETCVISIEPGWSGVLAVIVFQVDAGYDWLVVNGMSVFLSCMASFPAARSFGRPTEPTPAQAGSSVVRTRVSRQQLLWKCFGLSRMATVPWTAWCASQAPTSQACTTTKMPAPSPWRRIGRALLTCGSSTPRTMPTSCTRSACRSVVGTFMYNLSCWMWYLREASLGPRTRNRASTTWAGSSVAALRHTSRTWDGQVWTCTNRAIHSHSSDIMSLLTRVRCSAATGLTWMMTHSGTMATPSVDPSSPPLRAVRAPAAQVRSRVC